MRIRCLLSLLLLALSALAVAAPLVAAQAAAPLGLNVIAAEISTEVTPAQFRNRAPSGNSWGRQQQRQNLFNQQRQRATQQRALQQQRIVQRRQELLQKQQQLAQFRVQQRQAIEQRRLLLKTQQAQLRDRQLFTQQLDASRVAKEKTSSAATRNLTVALLATAGGVTPQLQERLNKLTALNDNNPRPAVAAGGGGHRGGGDGTDDGGANRPPRSPLTPIFNVAAPNTLKAKLAPHRNSGQTWGVDPALQSADRATGVLREGGYIRNPNSWRLTDILSDNGRIRINGQVANGQYMYVVTTSNEIAIGTRSGQAMPHPTLVGGVDPRVRAAGIVEIRGGRIYSVDNSSGHFKPDRGSLHSAREVFGALPAGAFHRDFQGYLPYDR